MGRGGAAGWRLGLLGLLVVLLAAAVTARADDLAATRQRLTAIEQRIRETAATVEEKRQRETAMRADLTTLQNEQQRLEKRIARQQATLKQLGAKVAAEEQRAAELKAASASSAEKVRQRLVALYKTGDGGLLRVLFSATSPARLAEDYDFFARIIGHDRELIATYRKQLRQRQLSLRHLSDLRHQQETALVASRDEHQALAKAGALRTRLLAALQSQRRQLDSRLADLRERARRLAALVKRLESSQGPAYSSKLGVFARQQGHLRWPLKGPVEVPYGTSRHPGLGTLHDSQGIEIGCRPGQKVRAVWAGRVIFANWFKGYGNLLIIDHGNSYYSLYAQAASLARHVGETVAAGDVVGLSGYQGGRHFYFEIRHSGTPLDPEHWLAARENQ